jgi:hypothetical protein
MIFAITKTDAFIAKQLIRDSYLRNNIVIGTLTSYASSHLKALLENSTARLSQNLNQKK